jgi:protein involved in polysaccharide export with SLBB domain
MNSVRNIIVWWRGALALVCGLFMLAGCETMQPQTANDEKPAGNPDIIQVGETLSIEFLDIAVPQKIDQTVQQDGSISLILGQKANVAGKNVVQAQNEIHDLYVDRFFKRLTVNIRREVRFFSVGGEVKTPGMRPYTGPTTVIKAIQSAGDFTVYADKKRVQVTRSTGRTEIVDVRKAYKNPKLDLPIYPGDQIHVPLSWK